MNVKNFEFNSLSIVSLNTRGLRDLTKRKALFLYCRKMNVDLILLQETHSCENDVRFWKSQWGDRAYFSHGSNHSAGVITLINKFKGDIVESLASTEGRWVILVTKLDNAVFIIVNIYGHNLTSVNKAFISLLQIKIEALKNKYHQAFVIFAGDFNEVLDNSYDRYPPKMSRSNDIIYTLCDYLQITDAWRHFHPDVKEYTWSNNLQTYKSRIDFFLVSQQLLQFVFDVSHQYAPFSDHLAIRLVLQTNRKENTLRGYWKLNNNLLNDKIFNSQIKHLANEIFSNCVSKSHAADWDYFKFKARTLAINRSKALRVVNASKEANLLNNINALIRKENLSVQEITQLKSCQLELDQLYIEIVKGAFVRSRAKWIEQGEKNTSFFFSLEKRNFKRKSISALQINNSLSKNQEDIGNFISNFYRNLYSLDSHASQNGSYLQQIENYIPQISNEFKVLCEAPISLNEIRDAMKLMKKGKSPGSDGLTLEFFIHFWEFLEQPFLLMLQECLENETMTPTMKQGVISLIPKPDKDPTIIDNWRPITLLNFDYKLLASIFAKRLKRHLHYIINETQTGFIKGRHISCNTRLVLDLIDYKNEIDSDAIILFLDFYKAFDTVKHEFLLDSLKAFGFPLKFLNVVQMLYKDINSCVILNSCTSPRFPVLRGIRQGCPLSPFLFLFVVETLSIDILHNNNLVGINIFNREIRISQLADDTTLFLKDKDQVSPVLTIINAFSDASGLKLNLLKCEIICLYDTLDAKI